MNKLKLKWALIEILATGRQNLLLVGGRKDVRKRLKEEKLRHKSPSTPPQRILVVMRLWKQWPKKIKKAAKAA